MTLQGTRYWPCGLCGSEIRRGEAFVDVYGLLRYGRTGKKTHANKPRYFLAHKVCAVVERLNA